ncbi:MAG: STAS/SEC14 domain-containing protein [Micavibrio sp.]
MGQTVFILPESNETTLCVRYTGMVDAENYNTHHYFQLLDRHARLGWFNMVVYYDDAFEGWTPEGAEANFKSMCEMGTKARKLAYVNPRERKVLLMKMLAGHLINGEIRYFETGEYADAVRWANEVNVSP